MEISLKVSNETRHTESSHRYKRAIMLLSKSTCWTTLLLDLTRIPLDSTTMIRSRKKGTFGNIFPWLIIKFDTKLGEQYFFQSPILKLKSRLHSQSSRFNWGAFWSAYASTGRCAEGRKKKGSRKCFYACLAAFHKNHLNNQIENTHNGRAKLSMMYCDSLSSVRARSVDAFRTRRWSPFSGLHIYCARWVWSVSGHLGQSHSWWPDRWWSLSIIVINHHMMC